MSEFEYPLVIGNIIHEAFERVIISQNFDDDYLEQVFKDSMKNHFCHIYRLRETEQRALKDLRTAATNIKLWVTNMLDRKSHFRIINYS